MADNKVSNAALQRAIDTINNLDKSKIAGLFSKMEFKKDPTLRAKAQTRLAKIERASRAD